MVACAAWRSILASTAASRAETSTGLHHVHISMCPDMTRNSATYLAAPKGEAFELGSEGEANGLGVTLGAPERGKRLSGLLLPTEGVGGVEFVGLVLCLLGPLLHVSPESATLAGSSLCSLC